MGLFISGESDQGCARDAASEIPIGQMQLFVSVLIVVDLRIWKVQWGKGDRRRRKGRRNGKIKEGGGEKEQGDLMGEEEEEV